MRNLGHPALKARILAPGFALACALLLPAQARPADVEQDFAAFEKIDVHMHLYGDMPEFAKRAREDGDVDGGTHADSLPPACRPATASDKPDHGSSADHQATVRSTALVHKTCTEK